MNKLQELWNKIVNFKPKAFKAIESTYKAIYMLNAILVFSVEVASKLGKDVSTIVKIGGYIFKIQGYIGALAAKLGIVLDTEFEAEVKSLVSEQSLPMPKSAAKRAKLTFDDIVNSQGAAFDKIDELLAD